MFIGALKKALTSTQEREGGEIHKQ